MSNIFSIMDKIAEDRIREAMRNGEFDNLEGAGKPLKLEDDRCVPDDLRLAYKVLKNADCLPAELELRKEITNTRALLSGIVDEQEKHRQMQKLNLLITKLGVMRRTSPLLEEGEYYGKVVDKMTVATESGKKE
jgi:hypothetical protein